MRTISPLVSTRIGGSRQSGYKLVGGTTRSTFVCTGGAVVHPALNAVRHSSARPLRHLVIGFLQGFQRPPRSFSLALSVRAALPLAPDHGIQSLSLGTRTLEFALSRRQRLAVLVGRARRRGRILAGVEPSPCHERQRHAGGHDNAEQHPRAGDAREQPANHSFWNRLLAAAAIFARASLPM